PPARASYFPRASDHRALHSFPTRRSSDLTSRLCPPCRVGCWAGWRCLPSERLPAVSIAVGLPCSGRPRTGSRAGPLAFSIPSSRSEEHTSELQSPCNLVCRLLLEKKKKPGRYFGWGLSAFAGQGGGLVVAAVRRFRPAGWRRLSLVRGGVEGYCRDARPWAGSAAV